MSELFKKLMDQIEMPLEIKNSSVFSSADIIEVKVHSLSRLWEFHFSFPELLPIEVYRELQTRLVNSFEKADIKATFDIRAETIDFSDDLLQDYYQQAFCEPLCNSASFKSSFSQLKVHYNGSQMIISAPQFVNNNHFRQNHLPRLEQQFSCLDLVNLLLIWFLMNK